MAVDDLQGELHMASETLDLTERLVNGCDNEISSAGRRSCFRKDEVAGRYYWFFNTTKGIG
jgi:hypothetical protein